MSRAKVQQPMRTFGYFPSTPDINHLELGRVECDGILARKTPTRRPTRICEPIHHWSHVTASWASDKAHRPEFIVLDDFDDTIGFGLAGARIDHPVIAFDHFPAATELPHRHIVTVKGNAVLRNPRRSDFTDSAAGDSQSGPLGIVTKQSSLTTCFALVVDCKV